MRLSRQGGGISAISSIIDDTTSPMILSANTIEENVEDRFRSILKKTESIEFRPIKHKEIMNRLQFISEDQETSLNIDVLHEIALKSRGDLRSATNDFETIARGKKS